MGVASVNVDLTPFKGEGLVHSAPCMLRQPSKTSAKACGEGVNKTGCDATFDTLLFTEIMSLNAKFKILTAVLAISRIIVEVSVLDGLVAHI